MPAASSPLKPIILPHCGEMGNDNFSTRWVGVSIDMTLLISLLPPPGRAPCVCFRPLTCIEILDNTSSLAEIPCTKAILTTLPLDLPHHPIHAVHPTATKQPKRKWKRCTKRKQDIKNILSQSHLSQPLPLALWCLFGVASARSPGLTQVMI